MKKNSRPQKPLPSGQSAARTSARGLAVKILSRIDQESSFSDILLAEALKKSNLILADRRLTTSLVYGVLRYRNQLDWLIEQVATVPLDKMPPQLRAILRSSVYQLRYLERIPAPAVVNEGVSLAHQYGHPGLAKFVNGVLRQLLRQWSSLKIPAEEENPVQNIALTLAHPEWLVRRWIKQLGLNECRALCQANNQQPPCSIRLNTLKVKPEQAMAILGNELEELTSSGVVEEGFYVTGPHPLVATPSYQRGVFDIHSISSLLVTHVLDPQPGETVLDACAGRGGKTSHLAQFMNNQGLLSALDPLAQKLRHLKENCHRLGFEIIQPVCGNLTAYPFRPASFDRILIDAPCSSLGTIRRHPEIKWLRKEADLPELSARQVRILENSSQLVKSNGILVYSVCSFEPEETTEVIERFLDHHPSFELQNGGRYLPQTLQETVGADGCIYIYPHQHNLDGFFIARLQRKV